MLAVQSVARGGVTVVSTIHSPTAFTYSLFDTLHMLVGGRSVYLGPPDASAVAYFTDSQPSRQLHPDGIAGLHVGSNSAELLTALVAEADRGGMGPSLADAYASSPWPRPMRRSWRHSCRPSGPHSCPRQDLAAELAVTRATVTPWWWGIWVYGKYRSARNYTSPTFLLQRVMDKLFISLLIMTLYLGVGDDLSDGNVMNVAAILFAWSAATVFAAAGYVPSLVLERGLFVRERADGLYHATTYLTAKLLDELVINTVVALGVAAFTLYGIQFANSFAVFYVSYIIGIFIGITAAYFVASIAPNMDVANALLPIYGTTVMFFAGFLIRLDAMPAWWKWYAYIDYAKYTWGAVMINQFKDRPQPWIGGQTVLEYFALDGVSEWAYLGYACLFFLFFYVSTALVLTFKQYQVR
ncbi:hypothetical protein HYH03_002498 [Edaphochlamys debaryana]|uniref:ABC-2 type transporter transmembrane domain-containing protein n=1 Tax=Edaphochlamys debaryana TaxID=47281 RepID=A0A835YE32_9CHLO|nr:hypothetical protein HYH03_002498 [Edaphochlamys debaryana]|eukprot:KAG2499553.1 hypothetical protein HYH03_002498 [Edaphochlamys debaryana]